MKAHIQGLTLDGTDSTSSPYTITKITGWDDGVGTRREAIDRPAAHGQLGLPGYLTGRPITIEGEIYTHSPQEQDHAVLALSGILAAGRMGALVIESGGLSTWATVQRNGAPTITRDRWGLLATYMVQLWAVDPRRYGEVHRFTGGEVAFHRGNFDATPVHEVTGTSAAYTISGPTGRTFAVSSGPGSGTDRIDMANGRVYRNGVLQLGIVTSADLWTIPTGLPGVTHTISAGSLVTVVTDTFV
ncbi:hypothetical protein WDU99_01855 [Microbacterium sp. Mu-80]|uniref:Phage tail protein n=1 Tax=Microbacterium bandirmense TaxID=3122050 RepID=A0ABU8L9N0_9MICO